MTKRQFSRLSAKKQSLEFLQPIRTLPVVWVERRISAYLRGNFWAISQSSALYFSNASELPRSISATFFKYSSFEYCRFLMQYCFLRSPTHRTQSEQPVRSKLRVQS